MTEQITIKLNKQKFEPVLKELREYGSNIMVSNSSLVAFALWFLHDHCFRTNPGFKMPNADYMYEKMDGTREQIIFGTIKRYRDWCDSKGLPCDDKKNKK